MIPVVNRTPKQKFNTTVYVDMQINLPVEAINRELAAGLAELAVEELIKRAATSPSGSLKLYNNSQFRVKEVNVRPHERSA